MIFQWRTEASILQNDAENKVSNFWKELENKLLGYAYMRFLNDFRFLRSFLYVNLLGEIL